MRGAVEIVEAWDVQEVVDTLHVVSLRREALRLDAAGEDPPLAIERTVLPGGATRPPVVLVHGFAQNRFTWRISGRSLAGRLAEAGHEVLNLELRGHGNSRRYGAGNARRFEEYVRDLVRVVDACETAPFALGHSLGGGVIVAAATQRSLRGLVPIAGVFTFGRHNATIRGLAALSLALERVLLLPSVRLSTGWAGQLLAELYGLTDIAGYGLPLAGWTPGSMERHLLEERLVKGFDWTSIEVWLQMSRWALGEPFAWGAAFSRVDVPLLVIAGDRDPLLPPEEARACYEASGSTDRRFVVFDAWEHGGHWGHLDLLLGRRAPEVTWPTILDWLAARS